MPDHCRGGVTILRDGKLIAIKKIWGYKRNGVGLEMTSSENGLVSDDRLLTGGVYRV
jgi:hypothetical protein